MTKGVLKINEIVQLSPETTRSMMFRGCLMTVTESKAWGAQGFVQMTGENGKPGGQAYYRAEWGEMEQTGGMAFFIIGSEAP